MVPDVRAQLRLIYYDTLQDYNHLNKISMLDPAEGYMAFSRFIGYTTDSGRHYNKKFITFSNVDFNGFFPNLTFGFGINGVVAHSRDTILVYGDYGLVPAILYSTNGGNTYKLIYHSQFNLNLIRYGIVDMVFPGNGAVGYAVDCDRVLKTTDRGKTWFQVYADPDRFFERITAPDAVNLFAFSTDISRNLLLRTTNAGANWTPVTQPNTDQLTFARFLTPVKGYIRKRNGNQNAGIFFTDNAGASWRAMNNANYASAPQGDDMVWINDSTGYALGGLFYTFKTTDSGKVWEYLPRDNSFIYLGYNHQSLFTIGQQLVWSGGMHGVLELSTNGGGSTLPAALMQVDTSGLDQTGIVKLINHSKPSYSFKWYKNNVLLSTAYNTSYTHDIFKLSDTLKLVVTKGALSDSMSWIQYFPPPVIVSGFTPASGATSDEIVITGINFTNVQKVSFGGVQALQVNVVSPTEIRARVNTGASGAVRVETVFNYGSKSGFTYIPPPNTTIPVAIFDSILCKSEKLFITIDQSEADVRYDLIDSTDAVKGTIQGNGATVQLVTVPIDYPGRFRIKAYRLNSTATAIFNRMFNVSIEKTLSRFAANRVNIVPGQPVQYNAISQDAASYSWRFFQDGSITNAVVKQPVVTYASAGVKTLTLISTSVNSCKDTLTAPAVTVIVPPAGTETNFAFLLDSTDHQHGQVLGSFATTADNGLLVIGASYADGKIRSRAGSSFTTDPTNSSYLARYDAHGILQWVHRVKNTGAGGGISAVATDASGNIYMAGYLSSLNWLHLANGDSLRFWVNALDTVDPWQRTHGFLIKMDPEGNYLWHTLLYDHTVLYQGYPAYPGVITGIQIRGPHIYLEGDFHAKLSWVRNGQQTRLWDMTGSTFYGDNQNKFILKISSDGVLKWKSYLDYNSVNAYGLGESAIDAAGNLYSTGYYEQGLTYFDKDSLPAMQLGGNVAYFRSFQFKLDTTGKVSWYNSLYSDYEYGDFKMGSMKVDDAGNSYLTGSFFNWGVPGKPFVKHSNGTISRLDSLTAFGLVKFDSSGKVRWSAGSRYPYGGSGGGLVLDNDRVFTLAQMGAFQQDLATFRISSTNGNIRSLSTGVNELLLFQYDTAGVFKKVLNSGYRPYDGPVDGYAMARAADGNFYIGVNKGLYYNGQPVSSYFGIPVPGPYTLAGGGLILKMEPRGYELPLVAQAGADRSKCKGDTVHLGVASTGALYSWSSIPAGYSSTLPDPVVLPTVNTSYILTVSNDAGQQVKDTVTITVMDLPVANAGADKFACPSQTVTIGTHAVAGLTYSWTSSREDNYTSNLAQPVVQYWGNSYYYLKVTNANGCSAYDTVFVEIGITEPVGSFADVSRNPSCKDSLVTFTGWDSYGGAAPTYRWQVNGKDAYNGRFYRTDTLKNGDQVRVIITTSNICSTHPVDTSNTVIMSITPTVFPTASVIGNTTVDSGQSVALSATFTLPGNYINFSWEDSTRSHSWQPVPGAFIPNITYTPKNTGDKLRFVYTTDIACANAHTVYSTVRFTLNPVAPPPPPPPTAVDDPAQALGIRIFPNPVQKVLYLDGLKLADQWRSLSFTDLNGKPVLALRNITGQTRLEVPVSGLAAGTYFGVLRDKSGRSVYFRWLKVH